MKRKDKKNLKPGVFKNPNRFQKKVEPYIPQYQEYDLYPEEMNFDRSVFNNKTKIPVSGQHSDHEWTNQNGPNDQFIDNNEEVDTEALQNSSRVVSRYAQVPQASQAPQARNAPNMPTTGRRGRPVASTTPAKQRFAPPKQRAVESADLAALRAAYDEVEAEAEAAEESAEQAEQAALHVEPGSYILMLDDRVIMVENSADRMQEYLSKIFFGDNYNIDPERLVDLKLFKRIDFNIGAYLEE